MRPRVSVLASVFCISLVLLVSHLALGQPQRRHNRLIDLLAQGKVVFGWFAPTRTTEAAKKAAADTMMDFVFLNMEQLNNYKPEEVKAFLATLREGGVTKNPNDRPLMVRLPIFHDDPAAARRRTAEVLNLGAHAVVFPDMESGEEAAQAIAAMRYGHPGSSKDSQLAGVRPNETGDAPAYWGMSPDEYRQKADVYPLNPNGELASVFIVESEKGVANSRDITRARPTVAFPGPGTLGRVFQGDMTKVENAIQTQLASCKAFNVPCGITAKADDIGKRIQEGFRVIIIYDRDYPETITVGRQAARRP